MLSLTRAIRLPGSEIELSFTRAQGSGGQNVNKVDSAVHLRFAIRKSSLPDPVKERLLSMADSRICADGVVVIKAQRYRSQEKNREDALLRLRELLLQALRQPVKRKPTKPSRSSCERRLENKRMRSEQKKRRRAIWP